MKKIPTLFKREFEGHKIVGIKNEFTDTVCEAAFLYGRATLKIDGSCCAIFDGKFYKRYDAKNLTIKKSPFWGLFYISKYSEI